MSNETFYCPFMGGNPCLGRKCGCTIRHRDTEGNVKWECGLVGLIYEAIDPCRTPVDEESYERTG